MNNKLNLFAILKGKNERTRVIVHTFIENDYTRAKLYFRSWMKPEENGSEYTLYKIGEIIENNMIKPTKIFISGGYEIKETEKKSYWINKNYEIKKQIEKEKEKYNRAVKEKNQAEIIKILFEGRYINE